MFHSPRGGSNCVEAGNRASVMQILVLTFSSSTVLFFLIHRLKFVASKLFR